MHAPDKHAREHAWRSKNPAPAEPIAGPLRHTNASVVSIMRSVFQGQQPRMGRRSSAHAVGRPSSTCVPLPVRDRWCREDAPISDPTQERTARPAIRPEELCIALQSAMDRCRKGDQLTAFNVAFFLCKSLQRRRLPGLEQFLTFLRHQAIVARWRNGGWSVPRLSQRYGVTTKVIYELIRGHERADRTAKRLADAVHREKDQGKGGQVTPID